MIDLLLATAAFTAAAYFVAATVAYDLVFEKFRRELAEAGWGSIERADEDKENADVEFLAFLQEPPEGKQYWRQARVAMVPPNTPLAKQVGLESDDETKATPSAVPVEADWFLQLAEEAPQLERYRRQREQLRRIRIGYRLARCAFCSGFHILNGLWFAYFVAWIAGAFEPATPWTWPIAMVPISHAARRALTRRYQ